MKRPAGHSFPLTEAIVRRHGPQTLTRLDISKALSKSFDFIEVFSPQRVGPWMGRLGISQTLAIDVVSGWDLTDKKVQKEIINHIQHHKPTIVMLSPPCTPFSSLQRLNAHRVVDTDLRDLKLKEGLVLLRFTMQVANAQIDNDKYFCFEHPFGATSFDQNCVKKLMGRKGNHGE